MATLQLQSSFATPASTLWNTVGFLSLADWHPMVPPVEASNEGLTRTMGFGRMVAVETLVEQGERTYTYIVEKSPMPVANYRATWTVTGDDDNASLTIDISYDPVGDPAMADLLLRSFFDAGFKALTERLV